MAHLSAKDRLFLDVARALGKKAYVGKAQMRILDGMELLPEERAILTTDASQAQIHIVPTSTVAFNRMTHILRHYRKRFNTIVAFRPCGDSMKNQCGREREQGEKTTKGSMVIYSLPYSKNSGFRELQSFIEWLRPKRLVG
eukprot:CAMPEP_0114235796 /NCGR_PEP_ID=MMETSP0058-20121206/6449_1 /TAXON_ID=36894 /ORGANISM="Pyramimonas parkeae, CCMP726" /LENGTH=140 /DNA_ID=CAMNT_0001347597 /DNA_START=74 /DNA_END=496 /DNA_ORIENTATION=-